MKYLSIGFIVAVALVFSSVYTLQFVPGSLSRPLLPDHTIILYCPKVPAPLPLAGIPVPVSEDSLNSLRRIDSLRALKNHEPWPPEEKPKLIPFD